jgi:putative ABC transport system permease protein
MQRYLPLIIKNTLRNRRRSVLTVLSIGISLCLLGVLMATYHLFYFADATPEQALRLWVRNRISLTSIIPQSYRAQIEKVPGVRTVMIHQWFGGVYKDARDMRNFFARFGTEPDKVFTVYPEYKIPEEQKLQFQRERTACIVGNGLVQRLGFKIGDRVILTGDIFPTKLELTVRGIYESRVDNENLLFHRDYMNEGLPRGFKDIVSNYVVVIDRPENAARITRDIDEMFRNSTVQTKTETEQAFVQGFLAFLGNVKMFVLLISAAVTFTILLVSGNTMAMSVRERVREVAILKTVGYTPRGIFAIILGESIGIALLGGAIGLSLAYGICKALSRGPAIWVDLKALTIPPSVLGISVLIAISIGLFSSFVPAWSASRRSIVESLRFTD